MIVRAIDFGDDQIRDWNDGHSGQLSERSDEGSERSDELSE